jgi:hypothetical protein
MVVTQFSMERVTILVCNIVNTAVANLFQNLLIGRCLLSHRIVLSLKTIISLPENSILQL